MPSRSNTENVWAEQALVLGITRSLASGGDVRGALHEVAYRLSEALNMDRGSILLLADDPNTLYVVATSESRNFSRIAVNLERYPEVRAVLDSGQPLVLEDAPDHPLMTEVGTLIRSRGIGSLVLFPLSLDDRPRGVILLRCADARPRLPPTSIALGRLVASILSLALHDPRMREALRNQTQRISIDSYERQRRQKALERYREFLEMSADGAAVVAPDGQMIYLNRAAEQIVGYSREALVDRPFLDLVAADHRDAMGEILGQVMAGAPLGIFDLDLINVSGERIVVQVATSFQKGDDPVAVLNFRDVTEARALADELRKTRDFLAQLIDSAVDGIVAADLSGTILLFNKGAERIYGYAAEDVVGKLNVEQLYPPGVAREVMRSLRSPQFGGVGRLEVCRHEVVARDGERVPVNLSAAILYEEEREIATVGIFSDLRDKLRIEQRLQQAQEKLMLTEKQAVIAELAGATAHELNQPLTSIMGYADLLRRRLGPDDPNRGAIDTIVRECDRMADVVRKIGSLTRYETRAYTGAQKILVIDQETEAKAKTP